MKAFVDRLNYDPNTGFFTWKRSNAHAGSFRPDGYIQLYANGEQALAHRVAWFIIYGTTPTIIDHINGKTWDNRIINLRDVTMKENGANRHVINSNNSSGVSGVSFHRPRRKWRARFTLNGKMHHVGTFKTKEKALEALNTYRSKL